MGTWGVGNFESDEAKDVLAVWIQKIVDEIQATFQIEDELELYQLGESHIVANTDILGTLHDHYHKYPDLDVETVRIWKDNYLTLFGQLFDEPSGIDSEDEFFVKRKGVVKDTFARLERILQQNKELYDNS
ncbi:MAG: hypothetical protein IPK52_00200 [Chloroflexi bacterium]|nr:hypothetical protein [Chloroflexota bacterium]